MSATSGNINSATSFTWTHTGPHFDVTLTFNSDHTQYKVSLTKGSGWVDGTSTFGYQFLVATQATSVVFDGGDGYSGGSGIILHYVGNNNPSTFTGASTGWLSVPSGITSFSLYAMCQAPNCTNGTQPANGESGNSGTFPAIFNISGFYQSPSNLEGTKVGASGTTVSFGFSWTNGTKTATLSAALYHGDDMVSGSSKTTTSNNTTLKWTGLSPNTSYHVRYTLSDGTTTLADSRGYYRLYLRTYGTEISDPTTTLDTASFTLTEYNDDALSAVKITYYVKSGNTTVKSSTDVSSGTTVNLTGLSPSTSYTITAYCKGIYSSGTSLDTTVTKTFTTKAAASGFGIEVTNITGETITVKATWTDSEVSESIVASITINGVKKEITSSNGTKTWENLSHGTSYSISASCSGSKSGSIGTESKTITTYGATIGGVSNTTKTATIASFGYVKDDDWVAPTQMQYTVYDSSGSTIVQSAQVVSVDDTNIAITGLSPNTSYKIKYWLGSPTDTEEWVSFTTGQGVRDLSLSVINTTGETITIQGTWSDDGYGGNATCTVSLGWYSQTIAYSGGTVTFTGLSRGSYYSASGMVTDAENNSSSDTCSGRTYKVYISLGKVTTHTQVISSFDITNGSMGDKSDSIRYRYKALSDYSYSWEYTGYINSSDTITGLSPGTTYVIEYYISGVEYGGSNDTVETIQFTTQSSFSDLTINVKDVTGTTISTEITWDVGGSTGVIATVICNGVSKSVSNSGDIIKFTGLTTGYTYNITCTAKDDESNTETADTRSVETYKVQITLSDTSTKALLFNVKICNGETKSKDTVYALTGTNTSRETTITPPKDITEDNLPHNITFTISAWIKDMVDQNNNIDTKVSITVSTKLLGVDNIAFATHQHSIDTTWQATANGDTYNKCQITNTDIAFDLALCSNKGVAKDEYQTPSLNGNCSGSYPKLVSSGLDYYAYYEITCTITDGYNKVSKTVTYRTTFPYARIDTGTEFKKAMPYIYDGSKWVLAPAFVRDTAWYESNGE
jgi:hypothetical protein